MNNLRLAFEPDTTLSICFFLPYISFLAEPLKNQNSIKRLKNLKIVYTKKVPWCLEYKF